jgi:hypothetical protein
MARQNLLVGDYSVKDVGELEQVLFIYEFFGK